MNDIRFSNYIFAFVLTLILYIFLLVLGIGFRGPLVTALFFLSSLMFIFTKEAKVENVEDYQTIPAAHYYQKSRLNIYGYMVAGSFCFIAFLFYIFSFIFSFDIALLSLILWAFYLGIVFIIKMYSANLDFVEYITDFIALNMPEIPRDQLKKIVGVLADRRNLDEATAQKLIKEKFSIPNNVADRVVNLYFRYLNGTEEELVSGEIEELNERKKKPKTSKK